MISDFSRYCSLTSLNIQISFENLPICWGVWPTFWWMMFRFTLRVIRWNKFYTYIGISNNNNKEQWKFKGKIAKFVRMCSAQIYHSKWQEALPSQKTKHKVAWHKFLQTMKTILSQRRNRRKALLFRITRIKWDISSLSWSS